MDITQKDSSSSSPDIRTSPLPTFTSAFSQLTLSVDEASTHTNIFSFNLEELSLTETENISQEQNTNDLIPSLTFTNTDFPPLPPAAPLPKIYYSTPKSTTSTVTPKSETSFSSFNSFFPSTAQSSQTTPQIQPISPFNIQYHSFAETDDTLEISQTDDTLTQPTATEFVSQLLDAPKETYEPRWNQNPMPTPATYDHPVLEAYLMKKYTYYAGWPCNLPYKWEFQRLISSNFPLQVTPHPFALLKLPEFHFESSNSVVTMAELQIHISTLHQSYKWKEMSFRSAERMSKLCMIDPSGLTLYLTQIEQQLSFSIHTQIGLLKTLPVNIEVLNTIALHTNFTEPISFHRNIMYFALVDDLGNTLVKVREIFKHIDVERMSSVLAGVFIKPEFSQYLYILFLYFLYTHLSGRETMLTFEAVVSKFITDPYVQSITPNYRYLQNAILDHKPTFVYMMSVTLATVQKLYLAKHIVIKKYVPQRSTETN